MLRTLLLAAITGYQRYVSPHKGFCCAYRVHTGRAGCSALGFRAVRRYGVVDGLVVLKRRIRLCGEVYRRHHQSAAAVRHGGALHSQQGFCDVGCDLPCDVSGGGADGGCSWHDLSSCSNCASCDWPSKRERKANR